MSRSLGALARQRVAHDEPVFRVAEINRQAAALLEEGFGQIWIRGELSKVYRAPSGHVYFTLSDPDEVAKIDGVVFKGDAKRLRVALEPGEAVRIRGRLSLYAPRGEFQVVARLALSEGDGDLRAKFEQLRRQLEEEGLFDAANKRALPRYPSVVGVATSLCGAAVHDVIRVAQTRAPADLLLADCRVQGEEAPRSIMRAVEALVKSSRVDVIIVTRGGGSPEDLWAFNDPRLARSLAACPVPVVCGVGHEVDVTLAELAADVRAATPSNAAELTIPDVESISLELDRARRRLESATVSSLGRSRIRLQRAQRLLSDPRAALGPLHRRLASLQSSLEQVPFRALRARRAELRTLVARLEKQDTRRHLVDVRRELSTLRGQVEARGRALLSRHRIAFATAATHLEGLSPLGILSRGYAIAFSERTGRAIRSADDALPGDDLRVRVRDGEIRATVKDE